MVTETIDTKVVKTKRGRPRKSISPTLNVPKSVEVVKPKRKGWKGYVVLEEEPEIQEEEVVELGLVGRHGRRRN
jgi:hypothetical protein